VNLKNVPKSTHFQVDEASMREAQRQWLMNALWEAAGSKDDGPTVPADWPEWRHRGYLPTKMGEATGKIDMTNLHNNLLSYLLKGK
jgi:hypothetical protein